MFPVLGYADLHCFSFVFVLFMQIYRVINVELWLLLYGDGNGNSSLNHINRNSHLALPGINSGLGWPRLWEQMCSFFWPLLGLPSALVSYPCWRIVAHLKKKREKNVPCEVLLNGLLLFFFHDCWHYFGCSNPTLPLHAWMRRWRS